MDRGHWSCIAIAWTRLWTHASCVAYKPGNARYGSDPNNPSVSKHCWAGANWSRRAMQRGAVALVLTHRCNHRPPAQAGDALTPPLPSRATRFQSTPTCEGGRSSTAAAIRLRTVVSIHAHLLRRAKLCWSVNWYGLRAFQSTPANEGRRSSSWSISRIRLRKFQSAPTSEDERNSPSPQSGRRCPGFNPHPPVKAGNAHKSHRILMRYAF